MTPRTEIDPERLERLVKQVAGTLTAGFSCAITAMGDRLGLFRALRALRTATAGELAQHTGLNERWLTEWLRHQAVVGHLEYDATYDRFHLSPEAVAVLLDESMPTYLAGGFDGVVSTIPSLPDLVQSFHTGIGRTYDDHGAGCACGIERLSAHQQKFVLVPTVLPMLDGVVEKLERGARVADVGCGAAQSTVAMAQAFPNSHFIGYDNSVHALERARANVRSSAVSNVEIVNPDESPLPVVPTFDLITTFDVVHDTPYPAALIAAIERALEADGTWLCQDIRSFPTFEQNRTDNPFAGLLYGFSVMVCMSAGMSKPDGAGLGTLGFNEVVAREMTAAAGFSRFRRLEHKNNFSNFYEIRR